MVKSGEDVGDSLKGMAAGVPILSCKRPGPSNPPPVWAETRQELAEGLPYYKAYQSGSYTIGPFAKDSDLVQRSRDQIKSSCIHKDFLPYAYLLGGFGSRRDAWAEQGKVVVSHGGGHAAAPSSSDSFSGQHLLLSSSQSRRDPRVSALLQSYQTGTPCILILGENYPLMDFNLNCGFAVLGWYAITACWAEEEEQGMVRWKVRFQWLDRQGSPWWTAGELQTGRPAWNPRIRTEIVHEGGERDSARASGKRSSTSRTIDARLAKRARAKRRRSGQVEADGQGQLPASTNRRREGDERQTHQADHWLQQTAASAKRECNACRTSSPQVYKQGWACLEPECAQGFWRFEGRPREDTVPLTFTDEFLKPFSASVIRDIPVPFGLDPTPLQSSAHDEMQGLYCPRCHRLSCREHLVYHCCVYCSYRPLQQRAVTVTTPKVRSTLPYDQTATRPLLDDVYVNARFKIRTRRSLQGPFEVQTYELPDAFLGSKIHLIQLHVGPREDDESGPAVLTDQEADEVLSSLQAQDTVPLRRHELTMHRSCSNGSKARLLTQMFTCNVGASYKHSTATETMSMSEAPECILRAGEILAQRTKLVVKAETDAEFNELYPCAYVQGMKMNYHDDGEPGLGPVVSSLSLGNVGARMNFRLKKKFVKDKAQSASIVDSTSAAKPKALPTILQAYRQHQKAAIQKTLHIPQHDRVAISLPLRHGSVVVQEGRALQECMEHAVLPDWTSEGASKGMRYAVTARRIDPPATKSGARGKAESLEPISDVGM